MKSCIFCFCLILLCLSWITPVNASVLSNQKITISVANEQSWTGRNGTGNLSYYGCDSKCSCIYLTRGKITCGKGICRTTWQHKNYAYVLSSPISRANAYGQVPSTLTISVDSQVISQEKLYPKPFDNLKPR